MPVFLTIVLDGVGIGAQPDAAEYGDEDSNTLGHVCRKFRPELPNLAALGLGNIAPLEGIPAVKEPKAYFGKMQEASAGKDSTTGHWELAGLRLEEPFPTYSDGFPADVIEKFLERTGNEGVLGNVPESGTVIIDRHGEEHLSTGHPIVYTSADSVFQIAAHKDVVSLSRLYDMCKVTRHEICVGAHSVGRVIARPFVGQPGAFTRISEERKDFSRLPERPPLQKVLQQSGIHTVSIGKIADLFGGIGFDAVAKTKSNADGIREIIRHLHDYSKGNTFIWANLVDFDQEYGHRNDVEGFARALEEFDQAIPDILAALPDTAHLVITADHGNDPTTPSTDHAREYVPVLYVDDKQAGSGKNLNLRPSFNDHAATVADVFGVDFQTQGTPFLQE